MNLSERAEGKLRGGERPHFALSVHLLLFRKGLQAVHSVNNDASNILLFIKDQILASSKAFQITVQ